MQEALSESKKQLLAKLMRGSSRAAAPAIGFEHRQPLTDAPVSYGQQQIWLHSQFSTGIPIYNEPVTIRRTGPFDRDALERSFTEIVRRHEAWRTTFQWRGQELVQHVQAPPQQIEFPYLDVSSMPPQDREHAALRVVALEAVAPFDFATGPLYRARLVRYSAEDHRLYLTLHHIIFDGFSLYKIFMSELQALYEAYSHGLSSPLDELSWQYSDYAIWQRKWVDSIAPLQLDYWRSKLAGLVRRDSLKGDHPGGATQSYRGAVEAVELDLQLSLDLQKLSQQYEVTLFMVLLTLFHVLLWTYTREQEIVLGTISAGRARSETEAMLGFFANTIVLRTSLEGDPSFVELLQRCKNELLESLVNDAVPFSHVVRELGADRAGGASPFFQAFFLVEPQVAAFGPGWNLTHMDVSTGAAKFDLHLELAQRPDGILGRFIYNSDLFEPQTIARMGEVWRDIIQRVLQNPLRNLAELVPLPAEVRLIAPLTHVQGNGANIGAKSPNGVWGRGKELLRRKYKKDKVEVTQLT